jgi:hypothetical protein
MGINLGLDIGAISLKLAALGKSGDRPILATRVLCDSGHPRAHGADVLVPVQVSTIIYLRIWFRGTLPRFRYDQLMNVGWKIAIPVGMAAVMVNALLGMSWRGSNFPR